MPTWMLFPPAACTASGGVGMVRAAKVEAARQPDPDQDPAAHPEEKQKLAT